MLGRALTGISNYPPEIPFTVNARLTPLTGGPLDTCFVRWVTLCPNLGASKGQITLRECPPFTKGFLMYYYLPQKSEYHDISTYYINYAIMKIWKLTILGTPKRSEIGKL
jgi:hypothetical protein